MRGAPTNRLFPSSAESHLPMDTGVTASPAFSTRSNSAPRPARSGIDAKVEELLAGRLSGPSRPSTTGRTRPSWHSKSPLVSNSAFGLAGSTSKWKGCPFGPISGSRSARQR